MYQKVSTDMNFARREEEVIKFWRDEDIFKKTVKLRDGPKASPPPRRQRWSKVAFPRKSPCLQTRTHRQEP